MNDVFHHVMKNEFLCHQMLKKKKKKSQMTSEACKSIVLCWDRCIYSLWCPVYIRSWTDIVEMHTNTIFDIFQHSVVLQLSHLSNLYMNNKLAFRFTHFFPDMSCIIYSFIFFTSLNIWQNIVTFWWWKGLVQAKQTFT